MKVKTAELKANLSHYLRVVQDSEEQIEVCIREQPVAYITRRKEPVMTTKDTEELNALRQRFLAAGLVWSGKDMRCAPMPLAMPVVAPDGRTDMNSVLEMRGQKDW